MIQVRFIEHFRVAGGPLYVKGDAAMLEDHVAADAIRQGAALRVQAANYHEAALDGPEQHKMIQQPIGKKGR